jgi:lipopolysaccharide biosynthesis glycosyltransferase
MENSHNTNLASGGLTNTYLASGGLTNTNLASGGLTNTNLASGGLINTNLASGGLINIEQVKKGEFTSLKIPNVYTDNAYVLCVFGNPRYMLGALVTAYSIKQTQSKYNIVCMVTPDIESHWIKLASFIFDEIVIIPYLHMWTIDMKTYKQQNMYRTWKNLAITKWNCLGLYQYKKILFIDADKIIFENIDNLFNLKAPAGTFSSPFATGYTKSSKGGIFNPYINLQHGDSIEQRLISQGLEYSFVVIATSILLEPGEEKYKTIKKQCELYTEKHSFGFPRCNSMMDEQFICTVEKNWTYISQKYNWIMWHPQWLRPNEFPPAVIHYFNTKPWDMKRDEWPDLQIWWDYAYNMLETVYKNYPSAKYLYIDPFDKSEVRSICPYCHTFNEKQYNDHKFIQSGKIICPLYNVNKNKFSGEL